MKSKNIKRPIIKKETINAIYKCWVCNGPLGYKPEYCCSGHMCGCMGLPTELPACSESCYKFWHKTSKYSPVKKKKRGFMRRVRNHLKHATRNIQKQ